MGWGEATTAWDVNLSTALIIAVAMLQLLLVALLLLLYRRLLSIAEALHAAILLAKGLGTTVEVRKALETTAVTHLAQKVDELKAKVESGTLVLNK